MQITCVRKYEQLSIYIDSKLHLRIKLLDLIGFQSWIHGESEYFIEYYFINNCKITSAYGKKEIWNNILELLDKHYST